MTGSGLLELVANFIDLASLVQANIRGIQFSATMCFPEILCRHPDTIPWFVLWILSLWLSAICLDRLAPHKMERPASPFLSETALCTTVLSSMQSYLLTALADIDKKKHQAQVHQLIMSSNSPRVVCNWVIFK